MYIYLNTKIKIPSILEEILLDLQNIGATPILVGGCVRDSLLHRPCKDYDVELFGIDSLEKVQNHLQKFGHVKLVGKSFGVLILNVDGHDIDFALARVERKVGAGHKGFDVVVSKDLTYEQASLRRDFTINSIGYDYFNERFLDPNGGIEDLKNNVLRHIKDETFVEDPLRVYRAVQFCSRFNLTLDEKTFFLCKSMVEKDELKELPKERVYEEFKKIFLKSEKPSVGFGLIKDLGILKHFPELEVLVDCEQDEEYHPEGDVWVHTLMTLDEMAKLKTGDEHRDLYLFYAILCHDLGKPFCTKEIKGKITSHKHEALGIEPTVNFMARLTNERRFVDLILPLVKNHLAPFQLYTAQSSVKAVKRLSLKVNIDDLCLVCIADCLGRDIPDKQKCTKATSWLLEKAKELHIEHEPLKPLVQGRDLMKLGLKPGKEFKTILEFALNLQIDEDMPKEQILEEIKKQHLKDLPQS